MISASGWAKWTANFFITLAGMSSLTVDVVVLILLKKTKTTSGSIQRMEPSGIGGRETSESRSGLYLFAVFANLSAIVSA